MRHGLLVAAVLAVGVTACGFDAPSGLDDTDDAAPRPDAPAGTLGGPSASCADPDTRLCLDFEEDQSNGVAIDGSGYAHNAYTDAVDTVEADYGGPEQHAASVTEDSTIFIDPSASLAIEGPLTVSMWVGPQHDFTGTVIVTDGHYRVDHVSGNAFSCSVGGREVHSDDLLGTERWTHVACTYDGTAVRLYVDGQFAACDRGAPSYGDYAGGTALAADLDDDDHFSGRLDQVRVLSRAQPQAEICGGAGLLGCIPNDCP